MPTSNHADFARAEVVALDTGSSGRAPPVTGITCPVMPVLAASPGRRRGGDLVGVEQPAEWASAL
jgi:hypothetical protein